MKWFGERPVRIKFSYKVVARLHPTFGSSGPVEILVGEKWFLKMHEYLGRIE